MSNLISSIKGSHGSSTSHAHGKRSAGKKSAGAGIAGASLAQMLQAARGTGLNRRTQPQAAHPVKYHATGAGHSKITPAGHKPPFNAVLKAHTMRFGA